MKQGGSCHFLHMPLIYLISSHLFHRSASSSHTSGLLVRSVLISVTHYSHSFNDNRQACSSICFFRPSHSWPWTLPPSLRSCPKCLSTHVHSPVVPFLARRPTMAVTPTVALARSHPTPSQLVCMALRCQTRTGTPLLIVVVVWRSPTMARQSMLWSENISAYTLQNQTPDSCLRSSTNALAAVPTTSTSFPMHSRRSTRPPPVSSTLHGTTFPARQWSGISKSI